MTIPPSASKEVARPSIELSLPTVRAAVALGVMGAWALLAFELAVALFMGRQRLAGVWEVQMGVAGLLPAWLLTSALPGLLGGIVARSILRSLVAERSVVSWSLAGVMFAFAAAWGWGVGGGRHLATLAARGGFALALGCTLGVATLFLLPQLLRILRRAPDGNRFRALGLGAVALALGLEAINTFVLVRLYPAFHWGLTVIVLALCGFALVFCTVRITIAESGPAISGFYSQRRPAKVAFLAYATGLTLALSGVLLLPGSRAVAGFDNFRWLIQEGPFTLAMGVDLASRVAPPPALEAGDAQLPLGARRRAGTLDLRGRDILLISVDALRADHLGAYGYGRKTSPAIDQLAKKGALFEAAYAPTPHTSYSVTSLMTGKYMRPLLLQGAGEDSDLWATLLRSYDYRTAAFYPPAVFYIDTPRFEAFNKVKLGFEYAKVEFAEGDLRISQVRDYLDKSEEERRVFVWVHLFGPHEPYVPQPGFSFGERDVDLYDGEIAAADQTVGRLVEMALKRDPRTLVILTADHGEEFGDHGGRYHGTSVYDEQVRVPLIIMGEGIAAGRRVLEPVQTIDLLPTVLDGLQIPIPPRIRGRSLTPLIDASHPLPESEGGRAVAETDDYTMLAQGNHRLLCQRRSGACQLYDTAKDPGQTRDLSSTHPEVVQNMRVAARTLAETHGKYESQGLRAEGKGWPPALLLAISGDASVAPTLATLLDDADVAIRRKSAELLFNLGTESQASALRLAMTREEDDAARAWIALALTRLGQGAPLVHELLREGDPTMRRWAALALAEQGDPSGEEVLIRWWARDSAMEFDLQKRLLAAFSNLRSKDAMPVLVRSLKQERLRPLLAATLAEIGDKDAKPYLVRRLLDERYHSARMPLAEAIVALGGDDELIVPFRRFLGVPDGLPGGLLLAYQAGILEDLGGPKELARRRLAQLSDSGVEVTMVVPPAPKSSTKVRLIVRCRSRSGASGTILVQPAVPRIPSKDSELRVRYQPDISTENALRIEVPARNESEPEAAFMELMADLPGRFSARPGHLLALSIFAPQDIELTHIAALPLREDLPPPPPEDWKGGKKDSN